MMRRCAGCFAVIEGRSDRRYCTAACKQRAHRSRNASRTETVTGTGPVPSVVRGSNGKLIATVARLGYVGGRDDVVLDVTYGRGLWWTVYRPANLVAHDIALDGVDFRHLPEADASAAIVCFDPPYITTGNRATSTVGDLYDRYGLGATNGWRAGRELIADGLAECARVVTPGGFVLAKCQDYVESGTKRWNSFWLVATAETLGLDPHDRVIHHSGPGAQPKQNRDGSPRRQVHVREVASFLFVLARQR
jgi:hypothetical protein